MRRYAWVSSSLGGTFALCLWLGCGARGPQPRAPVAAVASADAPKASEAPPPETQAELANGEVSPIDHPDVIPARLVGRYVEADVETLSLELVLPLPAAFNARTSAGAVVSVEGDGAQPYAFAALPDDVGVVEGRGVGAAVVWLRRARAVAGTPVLGDLYTPQLGRERGHHVRFRADVPPMPKSDRKVLSRWATAFALHMKGVAEGPWHRFAARRVLEVFTEKRGVSAAQGVRAPTRDALATLMETTTGALALQEALQHDRPLLVAANNEPRSVALGKLKPPASRIHPWDEMLRALGKTPAAEPLAAAVPAQFWYLRVNDVATLFRMTDELERFGTPAARVTAGDSLDRGLVARYATALGLTRAALEQGLGRDVLTSMALTGSDPYFREGTDLTVLLRTKAPDRVASFLDAALVDHEKTRGPVTRETMTYEGVILTVARSGDRAVNQWRARSDDLLILSNSAAAVKRVLDAVAGRAPRLADEKDFRFMLARDEASPEGALAFMGDRFVSEVVGARQKVLQARRQLALAELMTPGFAALLHGFVYGKSPASARELVASRLLRANELAHAGGTAIAWQPGAAARSPWGTPTMLTPIIDLPAPERVSESERAAYDRFARSYEGYWSSYIDPASIRLAFTPPKAPGAEPALVAALRVLPLIEGSDYNEVHELAGQARVAVPRLPGDGLRAVVGIGPTASLRHGLAQLAGGIGGRHGLTVDFLGEWAMAGIDDRPRITQIVKNLAGAVPDSSLPEPPVAADVRAEALNQVNHVNQVDEVAELARAPVYAAVAIRSATGAALALSALRLAAKDALGAMVSWGELTPQRGISVVRVTVRPPQPGSEGAHREVALFYALLNDVLLLALDEAIVRRLVDDAVQGRGPKPETARGAGAQLVVDLAAAPQGGLLTVAGWLLTSEMMRHSESGRVLAEALLRGAPERAASPSEMHALALAYFGGVPRAPHGGAYALGAVGVQDAANGSRHAPRWPALPVPGSPVDHLLRALRLFRAELRFDDEGRDARDGRMMRSLHVTSTLGAPP